MKTRLLAGVLLAAWAAAPAWAVRAEKADVADAARFKSAHRLSIVPVRRSPPTASRLAFERFNKKAGGKWHVRFDPRTGGVASLFGTKSIPYSGTPEQAARSFLADARSFLQIDPSRLTLLRSNVRQGISHLWFEQQYQGVPVEFGEVTVHLTSRGEVVHLNSKFEPNPKVSLSPKVSEPDALRTVAKDLGAATATGGGLVLLPVDEGLKLAWKYRSTSAPGSPGQWVYYVDAQSGQILLRYNELQMLGSCNPSPSGPVVAQVLGSVFDIDPYATSGNPVARPMPYEAVYVGSNSNYYTTNATGCFGSAINGPIFTALQGQFANVSNARAGSASFNNAAVGISTWTFDPTAVYSSPHPYPAGCPTNPACPPATVTVSPPITGNSIVYSSPWFSNFHVGDTAKTSIEGAGITNDDELVVTSTGGVPVGRYVGQLGLSINASIQGPLVPGPSYGLVLQSVSGAPDYGYDVGFSSYLVTITTAAGPSNASFVWTSTDTADSSLNEISLYYHLNEMHTFFDSGVNCSTCDNRAVAIDAPVMAMSHIGPLLANAFYNPNTNALYFGDGDGEACTFHDGCFDLSFDGDATVVHHEYTHFVHHQIFPIVNTGESGALSEALADYFSGTSMVASGAWLPAGNTPGGGVPGIASYLLYSIGTPENNAPGTPGAYQPLRTMDPTNGPTTTCSTFNYSHGLCFYLYPGSWDGEIHDDSQGISQALWLLRAGANRPNQVAALGSSANSFDLGRDGYGVVKSDRLAWEAWFYYPNDFISFLEAMVTYATLNESPSPYAFTSTDVTNIYSAFALHGISTYPVVGDQYEPNNGPTQATDYALNGPISATINPPGDVDFYSINSNAGPLSATMTLPVGPSPGEYYAYQMLLLDSNLDILSQTGPLLNINATPSGNCPDGEQCFSSQSTYTLNYGLPSAGQYFLMVMASQTDGGSASITVSTEPYLLNVTYPRSGAAAGSIVTATYDNDTIQFTVQVPQYMVLPKPLYTFTYARLLNQDLSPIPSTQSNQPGTFLSVLGTPSTPTSATPQITGQLQIVPGFNARFPAWGTVSVEIFGVDSAGGVVSLGASSPMNLSTNQNNLTAFNNVFHPNLGQYCTLRYDSESGDGGATIKIYTLDGRLVRTLLSGPIPAGKGSIDWNGQNDEGHTVASGVYFVRFKTSSVDIVQKIVVVK